MPKVFRHRTEKYRFPEALSCFYALPEYVYFQDWNTPDNDWLKTIPNHKYYYFAPFETRIPEKVSRKSTGVIRLGTRGAILKVD